MTGVYTLNRTNRGLRDGKVGGRVLTQLFGPEALRIHLSIAGRCPRLGSNFEALSSRQKFNVSSI